MRISLLGPSEVGKTTIAQELWKYNGNRGQILSFAGPLKTICSDLFGDKMDDPIFRRRALQMVGTDLVRTLDPDVWVRKLERRLPTKDQNVFVDDCRFPNEAEMLARHGFMFVRLTAPPLVLRRRRPDMTDEQHEHESEHALDAFPAHLVLSSTLPKKEIVQQINARWYTLKQAEMETI